MGLLATNSFRDLSNGYIEGDKGEEGYAYSLNTKWTNKTIDRWFDDPDSIGWGTKHFVTIINTGEEPKSNGKLC